MILIRFSDMTSIHSSILVYELSVDHTLAASQPTLASELPLFLAHSGDFSQIEPVLSSDGIIFDPDGMYFKNRTIPVLERIGQRMKFPVPSHFATSSCDMKVLPLSSLRCFIIPSLGVIM